MYNLKSIKQEFKEKGIFYTTNDLAQYIKSLIKSEPDEVYDPTCGDGSLLAVFGDNVLKYGQEINLHQLDIAKSRLTNFNGVCGNTLKDPAFFDKKFKYIVANPPFSIKWEPPQLGNMFNDDRFLNIPAMPPASKADYAFILHILHYLADDGIAVVLSFPGILYRGNSEGILRKWIVENNFIESIIRVPAKSFVDTTIETAIVIFKKNKKDRNITFIDKESGKSVNVSLDAIAKNDFSLSTNMYLINNKEKEIVDPIQLMKNARESTLETLKHDIEMDRMICFIENWDHHTEYLKSLQDIILKGFSNAQYNQINNIYKNKDLVM